MNAVRAVLNNEKNRLKWYIFWDVKNVPVFGGGFPTTFRSGTKLIMLYNVRYGSIQEFSAVLRPGRLCVERIKFDLFGIDQYAELIEIYATFIITQRLAVLVEKEGQ